MRIRLHVSLAFVLVTALVVAEAAEAQGSGRRGVERSRADIAASQRLRLPAEPGEFFEVEVRLGGAPERLLLRRYSLRSEDAVLRVFVRDELGERIEERALPVVRTYRGALASDPATVVLASFTARGFQAEVHGSDGGGWTVAPSDDGRHTVTRRTHEHALPAPCGLEEAGLQLPPGVHGRMAAPAPGMRTTLQRAQIAFDADFEYYQLHGSSVANVVARIDAMMNEVDYFYARDVLITYALTGYVVRTALFYTPLDGGDLLNLFRAEWNANQGGIEHDIGHLMTDKPGAVIQYGGLAWVGVVCTSSAYGWSLDSAGIIGHEVGHNWGAGHCHDTTPCNNMCGACLYVAPNTKRIIEAHRDSRACLETVGPYATPAPPYLHPERRSYAKRDFGALGPVTLDVLANEHDANGEHFFMVDFARETERGGKVRRTRGSGPRGRDELVYTFPDEPWIGEDRISYVVMDTTGLSAMGDVVIEVLPSDPQGYWPFDDGAGSTISDVSGNGHDVLAQQAVSWIASPVSGAGGAMVFNGTTQVLDSSASDFPPPWTASAWVQRRSTQGLSSALAESSNGSLRTEQWGTAQLVGVTRYGQADANFGYRLPLNVWTHLTWVGRAGSTALYVNGVLEASVALSINAPMQPAARAGDPLRAAVDELRVYPVALSQGEIDDLYLLGGGAVAPAPGDGRRLGLAGTALSWVPGLQAESHDVYFGLDWKAVRNAGLAAPEYAGNVLGSSFSPGALANLTTYFWRVDTRVGLDTIEGALWQFTLAERWRWALDETSGSTALQETGGANGAYVGSPVLNQAGATPSTGTSVRLDGFNDSVVIPALDLNSNTVTFSAWIRRDGAQTNFSGLLFSRDGSSTAGMNLSTGHQLGYHWNGDSATWSWNSALVVPDATWVFVALVVSPGRATMYLGDGGILSAATNTVSHGSEEFDGVTHIGRDPAGSRYFDGWVDDVRIHAAALSAQEISDLYLGTL